MRREGSVRLADGRSLAYAEYGDPGGEPVLVFHGFPGSRLVAELGDEPGAALGARVVGVDRPGWGRSDFKPRRSVLDWPDDVGELTAQLGIDRFSVIALSGGGPYAAACAYLMAGRVRRAAIVSAIAPLGANPGGTREDPFPARLTGALYRLAPRAAWWTWLGLSAVARIDPDWFLSRLLPLLPEADRRVFALPDVRRLLLRDFREALRRGWRGPRYEMTLNWRPWGFRLEDLPIPLDIWQGLEDTAVPASSARYLASVVPHSRVNLLPGHGHVSVMVEHMDQILKKVLE